MANFHALERMVDNAVGSTFSERVEFKPKLKDSGRPDNGRLIDNLTGVLHFPDEQGEISLRLGEGRSGVDSMVSGMDAALVIERNKYPDLKIFKDDILCATEAPGKPWYRVARVNTNLSSIIIVYLLNDAVGTQ